MFFHFQIETEAEAKIVILCVLCMSRMLQPAPVQVRNAPRNEVGYPLAKRAWQAAGEFWEWLRPSNKIREELFVELPSWVDEEVTLVSVIAVEAKQWRVYATRNNSNICI